MDPSRKQTRSGRTAPSSSRIPTRRNGSYKNDETSGETPKQSKIPRRVDLSGDPSPSTGNAAPKTENVDSAKRSKLQAPSRSFLTSTPRRGRGNKNNSANASSRIPKLGRQSDTGPSPSRPRSAVSSGGTSKCNNGDVESSPSPELAPVRTRNGAPRSESDDRNSTSPSWNVTVNSSDAEFTESGSCPGPEDVQSPDEFSVDFGFVDRSAVSSPDGSRIEERSESGNAGLAPLELEPSSNEDPPQEQTDPEPEEALVESGYHEPSRQTCASREGSAGRRDSSENDEGVFASGGSDDDEHVADLHNGESVSGFGMELVDPLMDPGQDKVDDGIENDDAAEGESEYNCENVVSVECFDSVVAGSASLTEQFGTGAEVSTASGEPGISVRPQSIERLLEESYDQDSGDQDSLCTISTQCSDSSDDDSTQRRDSVGRARTPEAVVADQTEAVRQNSEIPRGKLSTSETLADDEDEQFQDSQVTSDVAGSARSESPESLRQELAGTSKSVPLEPDVVAGGGTILSGTVGQDYEGEEDSGIRSAEVSITETVWVDDDDYDKFTDSLVTSDAAGSVQAESPKLLRRDLAGPVPLEPDVVTVGGVTISAGQDYEGEVLSGPVGSGDSSNEDGDDSESVESSDVGRIGSVECLQLGESQDCVGLVPDTESGFSWTECVEVTPDVQQEIAVSVADTFGTFYSDGESIALELASDSPGTERRELARAVHQDSELQTVANHGTPLSEEDLVRSASSASEAGVDEPSVGSWPLSGTTIAADAKDGVEVAKHVPDAVDGQVSVEPSEMTTGSFPYRCPETPRQAASASPGNYSEYGIGNGTVSRAAHVSDVPRGDSGTVTSWRQSTSIASVAAVYGTTLKTTVMSAKTEKILATSNMLKACIGQAALPSRFRSLGATVTGEKSSGVRVTGSDEEGLTSRDTTPEDVNDMGTLEKMLETASSYDQRRRIRAQMRVLKKNQGPGEEKPSSLMVVDLSGGSNAVGRYRNGHSDGRSATSRFSTWTSSSVAYSHQMPARDGSAESPQQVWKTIDSMVAASLNTEFDVSPEMDDPAPPLLPPSDHAPRSLLLKDLDNCPSKMGDANWVKGVNLHEVNDELKLHELLDSSEDYEDRKIIRARLKDVIAENRVKRDEFCRRREYEREEFLRARVRDADEQKRRTLAMYDAMAKSAPAGGNKTLDVSYLRGGDGSGRSTPTSVNSPAKVDLVDQAIRQRQKDADERKKITLAAFDQAARSGPAGSARFVDFDAVRAEDVDIYENSPRYTSTFQMKSGIPIAGPVTTHVASRPAAEQPRDSQDEAIRRRQREADERKRKTLEAYDKAAKSRPAGVPVSVYIPYGDIEPVVEVAPTPNAVPAVRKPIVQQPKPQPQQQQQQKTTSQVITKSVTLPAQQQQQQQQQQQRTSATVTLRTNQQRVGNTTTTTTTTTRKQLVEEDDEEESEEEDY